MVLAFYLFLQYLISERNFIVSQPCFISSPISTTLCIACHYQYSYNFADDWPGGEISFNETECKLSNRPDLVELLVMSRECGPADLCDGMLTSPMDNLIKALRAGWKSNAKDLRIYLLTNDSSNEGAQFFINTLDFSQGFQYLFRRFYSNIYISPLYCSRAQIPGCYEQASKKPTVFIRTQNLFVFIAKSLSVSDIIFDGSEIYSDHAGLINKENSRKRICNNSELLGEVNNGSSCDLTKKRGPSMQNFSQYGLFNIEIPIECSTCVLGADKLLLNGTEFKYFHYYTVPSDYYNTLTFSLITFQATRHVLHINNTKISSSFFPNGIIASINTQNFYTSVSDVYDAAVSSSKDSFLLIEGTIIDEYDFFFQRGSFLGDSLVVFIRVFEIQFNIRFLNSTFSNFNNNLNLNSYLTYFIFVQAKAASEPYGSNITLSDSLFINLDVPYLFGFLKYTSYNWPRSKLNILKNVFKENKYTCFNLTLFNVDFIGNILRNTQLNMSSFFKNAYGNMTITDNIISNISNTGFSTFIEFAGPIIFADRLIFFNTTTNNISYFEGAIINGNSFTDLNVGIVKCFNSLSHLLFFNNTLVNIYLPRDDVTHAKVERDLIIQGNIYTNITSDSLFNHMCFKNITINNNICIYCYVRNLLKASLYSSLRPYSIVNISSNLFSGLFLRETGFTFEGYLEDSSIDFSISNNIFTKAAGSIFGEKASLFELAYNNILLVNNSIIGLEYASGLSLISLKAPDRFLLFSDNYFEGSTTAPFEQFISAKDFYKLKLINCSFLGHSLKSLVPSIIYLSSQLGSVVIQFCFFDNLSAISAGALIIQLSRANELLILDCHFENNSGTELAGDIVIEISNKLPSFLFNLPLTKFPPFGVKNNLFLFSKGGFGGAITILEETQMLFFNNTFQGQMCSSGGSLYLFQGSEVNCYGDTVLNSSAQESGGYIYMRSASLFISEFNLKLAGASTGGAIYSEDSSVYLSYAHFSNISSDSGSIIYSISSILTIKSVIIVHTISNADGGAFYLKRGSLIIRSSNITLSKAFYNGGALYLVELIRLEATNLTIKNSFAGKQGVLFIEGDPIQTYRIKGILCESTKADEAGDCLFFRGGLYEIDGLIVRKCLINNCGCSFEGSSLLSQLTAKNVRFEENSFSSIGICADNILVHLEGILVKNFNCSLDFVLFSFIYGSIVLLKTSVIWNTHGLRFLKAESSKILIDQMNLKFNGFSEGFIAENCVDIVLKNVQLEEAGTTVYSLQNRGTFNLKNSNILLINVVIKSSSNVIVTGAILATNSNITVIQSVFIKRSTATPDPEIASACTDNRVYFALSIENTHIFGNPSVIISNLKRVQLTNVDFIGEKGNLRYNKIYLQSVAEILIKGIKIFYLNSDNYSPLSVISGPSEQSLLDLENAVISFCKTEGSGGALSVIGSIRARVSNCMLSHNSAMENGGAIFLNIPLPSIDFNEAVILENCSFFWNQASFYGNALKSLATLPILKNITVDNFSSIAQEFSSHPNKLLLLSGINWKKEDITNTLRRLTQSNEDIKYLDMTESLIIASGQQFNITAVVIDHYGNLLEYDDLGKIAIQNPLIGSQEIIFEKEVTRFSGGLAFFEGLVIVAAPGKNYKILLSYNDESSNNTVKEERKLFLRPCIKGEIYSGLKCEPCKKNYFSLLVNPMENKDFNCNPCVANAICLGADVIIPQNGFWRKDENQSKILKCKTIEACPEVHVAETPFKFKQICNFKYTGNICHNCAEGYGRIDSDECIFCSHNNVLIVKYILIIFTNLAITGYQIRSAITFDDVSSRRRSLLKLLMDHFTYLGLVSQFKIDWTLFIQSFLSINQMYMSPIPEVMFNFDCILNLIVEQNNKNLSNSVFVSLSPFFYGFGALFLNYIVYGICLFLSYLLKRFKRRNSLKTISCNKVGVEENPANNIYILVLLTCFITFYNLYPKLLINATSWLRCKEIDHTPDTYLENDPNMLCWEKKHLRIIFSLALPTLLVWCIFIPLILFYLTTKLYSHSKSKKLTKVEHIVRYLTIDYKEKFYYWDLFAYISKFTFVLITIACSNLEPASQSSLLTLFMLILLLIQENFKPFKYHFINNLFTFSYFVCICSGSLAAMSSSRNIKAYHKSIFISLIALVNLLFYILWLIVFVGKGVDWFYAFTKTKIYVKRLSGMISRRCKRLCEKV